jgi:acyl dehydratase
MWIHVDVERASREMPDGKTIAHGLLVLSLVPGLAQTIYKVKRRSRALNYGLNRVRYTGQVQVGSRVRTHQTIKAVDVIEGGARITSEHLVEIEGRSRPALVAETLVVMYD